MKPQVFGALAACAALTATLAAHQTPAPQTAAAKPPRPVVPLAATTLAADPSRYVGSPVSITAPVDGAIGDSAFSMKGVLVLAPILTAPVKPGAYVTVIGDVVRFDPAAIATRMKESMPVLPPDAAAKYQGRPAIIATSVINEAMTDLAKKPPPPMSPDELNLNKAMKEIGPGFTALRQALGGATPSMTDAAREATTLVNGFTQASAFWKVTPRPDAAKWTEDALHAAQQIAAAAGKKDEETLKTAVPALQAACASCHGKYRERLDDGSYRFNAAAK
jgi:cytochrome c556